MTTTGISTFLTYRLLFSVDFILFYFFSIIKGAGVLRICVEKKLSMRNMLPETHIVYIMHIHIHAYINSNICTSYRTLWLVR